VELSQQLIALAQIILIDLVLAGDNAIVVGLAASRVAPALRVRVIFWGVTGAVVLRIAFAIVATQLLSIVGLTLAGGILLLWVCWKMYREIVLPVPEPAFAGVPTMNSGVREMSFFAALTQIIVADVSMSLDNVLAVAGAAKGHIWIMAIGLVVAVAFMALVSAWIASLLVKHRWITWIGLLIILYVALEMVWTGSYQVGCQFVPKNICDDGPFALVLALIRGV
jgi:YjbE family integral membrane protein